MDSNDENKIKLTLKQSISFKDEDLSLIDQLPIFSKISLAQALLKEMISIKGRFDDNKNKMIEKIQSKCYTYYKNLIISQEIYDNCILKDDENRWTYILKNNSKKVIDSMIYLPVYNFLFLLRNNNKIMIRLINRCHTKYMDAMSYFIAHFCYENTINNNNSFIQEELQLIIYFIIEKIIWKNPEDLLKYDESTFLYKLLKNLIRKVDINNYLNSILGDLIIQINKGNNKFILELAKEANDSDKAKNRKLFVQKGKEKNIQELNDKFFIQNDLSKNSICETYIYYKNLKEKEHISLAMIYYLETVLLEINEEDDKYRNYYYFGYLSEKIEKKISDKEKTIENIKKKYGLIKSFILSLLIKIEESLPNMPQPLKNILNVLDILIEKKMWEKEKSEKILYIILMAKLKILIGNLILPMIQYLYSIRILNDEILTRTTVEFLKTIEIIFNSILQGKLFENNKDPDYTIYNKLIIEIFPKILIISLNIGQSDNNNNSNDNFLLEVTKTFDQIKDISNYRILNYDELQSTKKHNENIQYQSICFNWEIVSDFIKSVIKDKHIFVNENNKEEKKILEDAINLNNEIFLLTKNGQIKKECEYFFIDKIIYQNEFDKKIKSIIQDYFEISLKYGQNGKVEVFKKCLSVVLGYVGVFHKEDFLPFIIPKEKIKIYSNKNIKLLLNYKKYNLYEKKEKMNMDKNHNKNAKNFALEDKFFTRRKSVVNPYLMTKNDNNDENIDFKNDLFPQIMSLVKIEIGNIGNTFDDEKFQRIIFCLSYVQTHFDNLPLEYRKNNYSQIFIEIIKETKVFIQELQNNILNEFLKKIRNIEKINEIVNKNTIKIKNMENFFYIKYLHKNTKVYGQVLIENNTNTITKIKFEPKPQSETQLDFINSFVHAIPDFVEYYEPKIKVNENFLEKEEKIGLAETINEYFKELKNSVKKVKILSKLTNDEFFQVLYGLENYILNKLNGKLFPKKFCKDDIFLYKKCVRLSFIKPDNIIKDKKFKNINTKLLEISIGYIKEMEKQKTPMDIINSFGKAMNFLSNSMEFNSGKKDFGIDDLIPLLIYIIIKSKPERLYTNYNYCMLYLNNDLKKKHYGSLLTQIGVIANIIKNMKYNDLTNVTSEQFGTDEVY